MDVFVITTIILGTILFIELICFIVHKVKQHRRKKYKVYLTPKMRRQLSPQWEAIIQELTADNDDYFWLD